MPYKCRYVIAAVALLLACIPSEAARICQSPSIQNYYHTWVHMTYSCKDQSPSDDACLHYKPYTQWTDIGFESNSNGGGLRDESKNAKGVYECASWFTNSDDLANKYARGANAKQERMAIAGLVREGWATASYNIIGGLTSFSCDVSSSYKPRPNKQNVCWTFTCAYAAYLKQVLKVSPKSVTPSAIGIREADSVQVPVAWTCDPRQYASGDGCQCSCGAFDPDCDSMSSVATDCPNRDDVCIPGAENSAICKLRHQVLSSRKTLQMELGTPIHSPNFHFSDDIEGIGSWGNYSTVFIRSPSQVPQSWTCNKAFYGSNDGCDCNCGAWDPDCDATTPPQKQKVLNCRMDHPDVRCAMSASSPSVPVCLYDRVAATAATDAGFPPSETALSHSTTTVVAASVVSSVVSLVVAAAIAFIIRRRRLVAREASLEQTEVSLRPMNAASSDDIDAAT